ncbi:hypothetical protein RQP46_009712 [Phenoliferia psychrophenolica]
MITFSLPPSSTTPSSNLAKITSALATSKRTLVLVGAGISTSAGIQDFRSPTGLYASPSAPSTSALPLPPRITPQHFSAHAYSSSSSRSTHWQLIASLKLQIDQCSPTPTHSFFALLKQRRSLRRVYSQNIDGLELRAGLDKVAIEGTVVSGNGGATSAAETKGKGKAKWEGDYVALHGDVNLVRCTACDFVGSWDKLDIGESFSKGETMDCPNCVEIAYIRRLSLKRTPPLLTYLRPSLVLYDESPPHSAPTAIAQVAQSDLDSRPDFLFVMGTSLKIPGFKDLVRQFAKAVKREGGLCVLVNGEKVAKEWDAVFDYQVLGKSDDFVTRIVADWKTSRPRDWVKQTTLDPNQFVVHSKPSAIVTSSKSSKPSHPTAKSTPTKPTSSRQPLHALPTSRFTNPSSTLPLPSTPLKKRPPPSHSPEDSTSTPTPSSTKKRRVETFAGVVVPVARR